MKVGLLHYSAPPVVGGVESVMRRHAELMAAAGLEVRFVAGRGEPFDPRIGFVLEPLADSRHPEILAAKKELDRGRVPPQFPDLVARLASALRKHLDSADVVIGHNVGSLHKNLALTEALRSLSRDHRVILWHHDPAWATVRYRSELHEGYPWNLIREAWPDVVQVAVSSQRQKELTDLMQIPLDRVHVIPNGIDVCEFLGIQESRFIVDRLHLLDAAPLLLAPVRMTPRKNLELALRAVAELRQIFPQAMLLITGPPGPHNPANAEYFAMLRSLRDDLHLSGAAHFLAEHVEGYAPDAMVRELYRLADALLMPSRDEGFGLPILEAGLRGIPVFCSRIPALLELAGDDAHHFPPDSDAACVARLMARVLNTDLAFRLRRKVQTNYRWEALFSSRILPLLRSS